MTEIIPPEPTPAEEKIWTTIEEDEMSTKIERETDVKNNRVPGTTRMLNYIKLCTTLNHPDIIYRSIKYVLENDIDIGVGERKTK